VSVAAESPQYEALGVPEVEMRAAGAAAGQPAQAGGGEVLLVSVAGLGGGVGVQEGVSVFGDEAEQQPVDEA
jgi:hypothetical protein